MAAEPTEVPMTIALANAIAAAIQNAGMPYAVTAAWHVAVKQDLDQVGDTPEFTVLTFLGGKGELTSNETMGFAIGIRIVLLRRLFQKGSSDPTADAKAVTCELLQQKVRELFVSQNVQFVSDGNRQAAFVGVDFEQQYELKTVIDEGVWRGGQTLKFFVSK